MKTERDRDDVGGGVIDPGLAGDCGGAATGCTRVPVLDHFGVDGGAGDGQGLDVVALQRAVVGEEFVAYCSKQDDLYPVTMCVMFGRVLYGANAGAIPQDHRVLERQA